MRARGKVAGARALFLCIALSVPLAFAQDAVPAPQKGPYLQYAKNPSEGEITVVWETAEETKGWVKYKAGEAEAKKVESKAKGKRHEVVLAGLIPGTAYTYTLGGGASGGGTFTVPKKNLKKFRFVVIGDPRAWDEVTKQLTQQVVKDKPDFIIGTGDYVDSAGNQKHWQTLFDTLGVLLANIPFFPSIGDHDHGDGGEIYRDYFVLPGSELDYSYDWGNCHFIATDITWDGMCKPSTKRYRWVEKDLEAAQDADFIFIYYHLPAYTTGHHTQVDTLKRAQRLFPLFTRYGGDVSFAGHDHNYQHWEVDAITHVVSGGFTRKILYYINDEVQKSWESTGFIKKAGKLSHYMLVEVDGDKLTFTAKGPDGNVIESFERKNPPRPMPKGELKDGKREGVWQYVYGNSKVHAEITYSGGVKNGRYTCWYPNGQKWEEGAYKNGGPDGKWTSWYHDGTVKEQSNYKDGKLHGEQWYYYRSGKRQELQIFKEDLADGTWVDYKQDGTHSGEYKFKDGKAVK